MDKPWYDDQGKIMARIVEGGLKGLNEVAHARHEAHYERGEMLSEYIIEGAWWTDSCGNWGKIIWPKGRPDLVFFLVDSPADYERFCLATGLPTNWSASMSWELPPDGMVCDICKEPWTLLNAHLAVVTRRNEDIPLERFVDKTLREVEEILETELSATVFFQPDLMLKHDSYKGLENHPVYPDIRLRDGGWVIHANKDLYRVRSGEVGFINVWRYRHPLCQEKRLKERETAYFEKVFAEAGYKQFVLDAIPNEYCGDPTCCGPWFMVRTEAGNFKVGWRKRVINLEWAGEGIGSERNLLFLFRNEDVTKDSSSIHAWGREKLIDYLQRIHGHQLALVS